MDVLLASLGELKLRPRPLLRRADGRPYFSMSTDPESRRDFGPFLEGVGPDAAKIGHPIRYNNVDDVKRAFEAHGPHIAAFLVEPIQGEAG